MTSSRRRLGPLIGAIDHGTSSTRFLVFVGSTGELVTYHQVPVVAESPEPGWHRVDPQSLVQSVVECIDTTVANLEKLDIDPGDVVAVGITTNRNSAFCWDKVSGKPSEGSGILGNDTRSQTVIDSLLSCDFPRFRISPERVRRTSGIPVSCHFAASKFRWLLENVGPVGLAADAGTLAFGTADSWLIWALTNEEGGAGGIHMTDVTHASLTGLMNLETLRWDPLLCNYYGIPLETLPKIRSCSEVHGHLAVSSLKGVPISGCIGDQQAALVGQNCWRPGQAKTTFGSGSSTVYNVGPRIVYSSGELLSVVAYKLGEDDPVYALEGSVGVSGSAVDWLKSNVGIIEDAKDVERLASQVEDSGDAFFVPSFSGHQTPLWEPSARGLLVGLTFHTNRSHICRAALDAVAFQTRDVLDAMQKDSGIKLTTLLVDGGMSSNNLLLQIQADTLGMPVLRPSMPETSALGAAVVAGLAKGVEAWKDGASIYLAMDRFNPRLTEDERDVRHERWKDAVSRSLDWKSEKPRSIGSDSLLLRRSISPAIFFFTSFLLWKISWSMR